ncbi:hypothetical protein Hanom_Chr03g00183061 [Helianthus anomalus]
MPQILGISVFCASNFRELLIYILNIQREEELLSNWWREYGECSVGPKGSLSSISESNDSPNAQSSKLYANEEERVGVPVKGGLYEVHFGIIIVVLSVVFCSILEVRFGRN